MREKIFILFLLLFVCKMATAQNGIVSSDGTLNDKFGKKAGSLRFSATTLKFGRIKNNATKTDTIRIFNSGSNAVNLSLGKIPSHLTCQLQSSSVASNEESWMTVSFDAAKKNDYGFVLDGIELITNDPDQQKKNISVTATIEEFFPPAADSVSPTKARWAETTFDYGHLKQGDKLTHEFIVYNDGKKDLQIHKTKTNCGCLKAKVAKPTIAPGDSTVVKVDFDSFGKEGKDSRKVNVYLNDPAKPDVTIEMKGEISK